jgi:hypothetical protein
MEVNDGTSVRCISWVKDRLQPLGKRLGWPQSPLDTVTNRKFSASPGHSLFTYTDERCRQQDGYDLLHIRVCSLNAIVKRSS